MLRYKQIYSIEEARQITPNNLTDLIYWIKSTSENEVYSLDDTLGPLVLHTEKNIYKGNICDWVVLGTNGKFYIYEVDEITSESHPEDPDIKETAYTYGLLLIYQYLISNILTIKKFKSNLENFSDLSAVNWEIKQRLEFLRRWIIQQLFTNSSETQLAILNSLVNQDFIDNDYLEFWLNYCGNTHKEYYSKKVESSINSNRDLKNLTDNKYGSHTDEFDSYTYKNISGTFLEKT